MIVKDVSLNSPEENILLDEALFLSADKGNGGECLRFWESPVTFIVLGRIGKEHDDIEVEMALKEHVPVLRRSSGGGTVVQGRGCLNYTLILAKNTDPALADLRKSYQWISAKVIEALKNSGVEAQFHPISDIALVSNHKKFSGNAQRRGKNFILHHGTILYDFDLSLITRYLKMPKDVPEYRSNRQHSDFVTNIPIKPSEFKALLSKIFKIGREESFVNPSEQALLEGLKAKSSFQVDLYRL
jgi:lipoate---protein ligase